jgi:uncharacterized protein YktB (UPF0637 family)
MTHKKEININGYKKRMDKIIAKKKPVEDKLTEMLNYALSIKIKNTGRVFLSNGNTHSRST